MTDSPADPVMRAHTTSNRIRRHDAALAAEEPVTFTRIVPEPPPSPVKPPRPVGDLSAARLRRS